MFNELNWDRKSQLFGILTEPLNSRAHHVVVLQLVQGAGKLRDKRPPPYPLENKPFIHAPDS